MVDWIYLPGMTVKKFCTMDFLTNFRTMYFVNRISRGFGRCKKCIVLHTNVLFLFLIISSTSFDYATLLWLGDDVIIIIIRYSMPGRVLR